MPREQPLLDPAQREKISVPELARHILCHLKLFVEKARDHGSGYHFSGGVETFSLPSLQEQICPENKVGCEVKDSTFSQKFYEAIALLKQRGLLMDGVSTSPNDWPRVQLTSDGETANFDDEIPIQIDDAQEIVDKVKTEITNLDPIVERCYLESLQTCQHGFYISSVIVLGVASERAIKCLAEAAINHDDSLRENIEKQRNISALTRHLSKDVDAIFASIANSEFRRKLRDRLEGMAQIYRRNRNEAGHPDPESFPQDWQEDDEQESHLKAFRGYISTVFKAIAILEDGEQNETE